MAIQFDPNWPGASDKDESEDPYTNRSEVQRIAGDLHELLKKLTTSSGIPVTEYAVAPGDPVPGPQLPTGAGSLPDLQTHCALSQEQMGQWPAAMQYGTAAFSAYSLLIGEPGTTSGLYTSLNKQAEESFDAVLEIARTSQTAEQATEEATSRQA
ncbi:hypothetical protein [Nonomuraea gerenzanensis]|uniref:Uncharacterized protein n=1 Tax=Nonomuraea gerenzanensis TaxID=93944 RepID=A0A1M4E0H0_9ACTN|nr:hypothetical protein [Nonomuraea gerenzanensis]UBU14595.1 hypothetical protein LCN96_06090 [Nonomuraea gerenzanensis]SBO92312.1 hypothetical protein BN4615_P1826 [Nonomuraea gerenzanensis]